MKITIFLTFFLHSSVLLFICAQASAQNLEAIEKRMEAHSNKIIDKLEAKESSVKATLERERDTWEGRQYNIDGENLEGAQEHPWIKNGNPKGANPNSRADYRNDSKRAWDSDNFTTETWSCFEPQLIAYGDCGLRTKGVTWDSADDRLMNACQQHCCAEEAAALARHLASAPFYPISPFDQGGTRGDLFNPDLVRGGWRGAARAATSGQGARNQQEYFEVIQFWFPENQAAINNYGRMRVNPQDLTGAGKDKFTLDELLKSQRESDQLIKNELDENLGLSGRDTVTGEENPDWRNAPLQGQYQDRGGASKAQDQFAAHVYRSHISSQFGDDAPKSRDGYSRDRKSIFDALEKDTEEKDQLNIWTEYEYFDFLTSVNSASFSITGDYKNRSRTFMEALYGSKRNYISESAEDSPRFLRRGSIAYRAGQWDQFASLKENAGIKSDSNDALKEIVYFNGLELYPLTMSYEGISAPEISMRAMSARKAFEIAGNKKLAERFPGKEKARMNSYTISNSNKAKEIDKMQSLSGVRECFRTQKIPNSLQTTEDEWTEENFPSDFTGYVSEDNSDTPFMYWNKRVACTCKWDANPGSVGGQINLGSQAMNWVSDGLGAGRGDGDRVYGKLEDTLCTYREGQLPSAFAGTDTPRCTNGRGQTKEYEGLKDDVPRSHR